MDIEPVQFWWDQFARLVGTIAIYLLGGFVWIVIGFIWWMLTYKPILKALNKHAAWIWKRSHPTLETDWPGPESRG